jgi:predicted MFS family arabinose efflux permease
MMLVCSFASAVTAANMYYTYPVLNKAADDFGVTYERASLIPQLLQAGYGCGILLLCPLGDVFRLRPIILTLMLITTFAWLGLCITSSFEVLTALSFVTGFVTMSPQLMLPLVGVLAPPERRATAVSIVLAGTMMGVAVPRVITGIVTEYTSWRNSYWAALALQSLLLVLLWALFPDYPRPAPGSTGPFRTYIRLLGSIARTAVTEPILAYGCAVTFLANAALGSFWTTLTAHLAAAPFGFGPLQIGLFSILAIGTTSLIPVYSYLVIERFATYFASTFGLVFGIVTIALDAYTADDGVLGIGGPIIQAVGIDLGVQIASVAYRAAVVKSLPESTTNRANVIFTANSFIGKLAGTSVGNALYARGGWSRVGTFNLTVSAATLVLVYVRGPKETGWFGWTGGVGLRLDNAGPDPEQGDTGGA